MIKFILFTLITFLVILILGIGFMSRFVRSFTKRSGSSAYNSARNRNNNQSQNSYEEESDNKKVFSKDEGEYVDYEEIK